MTKVANSSNQSWSMSRRLHSGAGTPAQNCEGSQDSRESDQGNLVAPDDDTAALNGCDVRAREREQSAHGVGDGSLAVASSELCAVKAEYEWQTTAHALGGHMLLGGFWARLTAMVPASAQSTYTRAAPSGDCSKWLFRVDSPPFVVLEFVGEPVSLWLLTILDRRLGGFSVPMARVTDSAGLFHVYGPEGAPLGARLLDVRAMLHGDGTRAHSFNTVDLATEPSRVVSAVSGLLSGLEADAAHYEQAFAADVHGLLAAARTYLHELEDMAQEDIAAAEHDVSRVEAVAAEVVADVEIVATDTVTIAEDTIAVTRGALGVGEFVARELAEVVSPECRASAVHALVEHKGDAISSIASSLGIPWFGAVDGYCHLRLANPGSAAWEALLKLGPYPSVGAVLGIVTAAIPSDLRHDITVSARMGVLHVEDAVAQVQVGLHRAANYLAVLCQANPDDVVGGSVRGFLAHIAAILVRMLTPTAIPYEPPGWCYRRLFTSGVIPAIRVGSYPTLNALVTALAASGHLERGDLARRSRWVLGRHMLHVCAVHENLPDTYEFYTEELIAATMCGGTVRAQHRGETVIVSMQEHASKCVGDASKAMVVWQPQGRDWHAVVPFGGYALLGVVLVAILATVVACVAWVCRRVLRPLSFRVLAFGSHGDVTPMAYYGALLTRRGHRVMMSNVLTAAEGRAVLLDMERGNILARAGTYATGLDAVDEALAHRDAHVITNVFGAGIHPDVVQIDYCPPASMIGQFRLGMSGLAGLITDAVATVGVTVANPTVRIGSFPGYAPRSCDGVQLLRATQNRGSRLTLLALGSSSIEEPDTYDRATTWSTRANSIYTHESRTDHAAMMGDYVNVVTHGGAGTMATAASCGCVVSSLSTLIDRGYIGTPTFVFESTHEYFWAGLMQSMSLVYWPRLFADALVVDGLRPAIVATFVATWRRSMIFTVVMCLLGWFSQVVLVGAVFDPTSLLMSLLSPAGAVTAGFWAVHGVLDTVWTFCDRKVERVPYVNMAVAGVVMLRRVTTMKLFWVLLLVHGPVFALAGSHLALWYLDHHHFRVMGTLLRVVAFFHKHKRTDTTKLWLRFTVVPGAWLPYKFHVDVFDPTAHVAFGATRDVDGTIAVYRENVVVSDGLFFCTEVPVEAAGMVYARMQTFAGQLYTPLRQCQTVAWRSLTTHSTARSVLELYFAMVILCTVSSLFVGGTILAVLVVVLMVAAPAVATVLLESTNLLVSAGGDGKMGLIDLVIYLLSPIVGDAAAGNLMANLAGSGSLSFAKPVVTLDGRGYKQAGDAISPVNGSERFTFEHFDHSREPHAGYTCVALVDKRELRCLADLRKLRSVFRSVVVFGTDMQSAGNLHCYSNEDVDVIATAAAMDLEALAICCEPALAVALYTAAIGQGLDTKRVTRMRARNWSSRVPDCVLFGQGETESAELLMVTDTCWQGGVADRWAGCGYIVDRHGMALQLDSGRITKKLLAKAMEEARPAPGRLGSIRMVRYDGRITLTAAGTQVDLSEDVATIYRLWTNSCLSVDAFVIEARKNMKSFCNRLSDAVERTQIELRNVEEAQTLIRFVAAAERVLRAFRGPAQRMKGVWFAQVPAPRLKDMNSLGILLGDATFVDTGVMDVWRHYMDNLNASRRRGVGPLTLNAFVRQVNRNPYIDTYLSKSSLSVPDVDVPDGADGVKFATRQVMLSSLTRYAASQTVLPFLDQRADELAAVIARANPELYEDAKLADPRKLVKHVMKHPKYSPGLPFAGASCDGKRIKNRRDAQKMGWWNAVCKVVESNLGQGLWFPTIFHAFPKSQIVPRSKLLANPGALRSIIAASIYQMMQDWVFTFEINKRRHWTHAPGKVGMPMNGACMARVFSELEGKPFLYQADLTKADSSYQCTVFQVLARLRALGFRNHPQADVIKEHIRCMYEANQKGFIINLIADEPSAKRIAEDSTFGDNLKAVDPEGWATMRRALDGVKIETSDLFPGGVLTKLKGATQGGSGTTWDNCEALKIVLLDAISVVHGIPLEDAFAHMVLSNVGDDNVFGTDFEVDMDGVRVYMKERHDVTVKLDRVDSVYDLDFLSKSVRPGVEYDGEFKLARLGTPKYAVLHKLDTLLMRYGTLKQEASRRLSKGVASSSTYMLERILGYVTLTAHHRGAYDMLARDWLHFVNLVPPKVRATERFRKQYRFPSYEAILRQWYKGGDMGFVDELTRLQMQYNWVAHTHFEVMALLGRLQGALDAMPADLFHVDTPAVDAVTSAFSEKTFIIETHVYLQYAHQNPGSLLSPSDIATEVGYTPFYAFCNTVEFMSDVAPFLPTMGVELDDAVEVARNRALLLCAVYYQIHSILGLMTLVPTGQIFLALFNLYSFSMPRLYSMMGSVYWLSYGRPNATISNLVPRDMYYNHKALAIWLIAKTKPTLEKVVRINGILKLAADTSVALSTLLTYKAGSGSPTMFAPPAANPWSGFVAEIVERLSVDGSLLIKAPTGTGKTYWFPQVILGREITYGAAKYTISYIFIVTTRGIHCEQLGLPGVQRLKRRVAFDPVLSRFAVMTYGHLQQKLKTTLDTSTIFPPGTMLQFDEFHEEPPEAVWVIERLRSKYPCVYTSATPGQLYIIPPTEVFVCPIKSKHVVSAIEARGYGPVDALIKFEREHRLPKRVLIIEPKTRECEKIAQQLRTINRRVKIISAKDRTVPDDWGLVLVATAVIESGVTVPGVDLVIDASHRFVSHKGAMVDLFCDPGSSEQREGRTGRTNDGVVIRLAPVVDFRVAVYPDVASYLADPTEFSRYRIVEDVVRSTRVPVERRVLGNAFAIVDQPWPSGGDARQNVSFYVNLLALLDPVVAMQRFQLARDNTPDEADEFWLERYMSGQRVCSVECLRDMLRFHNPHYVDCGSGAMTPVVRIVNGRLSGKPARTKVPPETLYRPTTNDAPQWDVINRGNL